MKKNTCLNKIKNYEKGLMKNVNELGISKYVEKQKKIIISKLGIDFNRKDKLPDYLGMVLDEQGELDCSINKFISNVDENESISFEALIRSLFSKDMHKISSYNFLVAELYYQCIVNDIELSPTLVRRANKIIF